MIDNAAIAELLIREAENASGHRELAFRRAASEAFMWPEEATELLRKNRPLTELDGIGPSLARHIQGWIEKPSKVKSPPIRDGFLTLAQARKILSKNRPFAEGIKGDLQMHTVWSDGAGSIAEMATAAHARGYCYIGITDHTEGLQIAGGLNEAKLLEQGREIKMLNQEFKKQHIDFTILRSAEMNLSPTGEGDMRSSAMRKLDLVLGCFHSALRKVEDQTGRYVAGLRNPDIQILGHPQTRVYNHREGLRADWARVFGEAARLGKAVEIDGYADRQDLRVSLLKTAKKEGVFISLGTDAHHPDQLAFMDLALAAACLAKIPAARILNFMPAHAVKDWAQAVRGDH